MAIPLPMPIAAYFEADKARDPDAGAACFTQDAIVTDEGKTHRGRAAVHAWMSEASQAFSYMVEPFDIGEEGERTIVTGHVTGNFPGSPVDLRFFFTLRDAQIAELEIKP